ncbi:MAG TPA: FkbM family methyltransferase [Solirubrobacteraceae bacterium]|jgi:FkbM family methyltransferase|nr:FkbM family methyltransferase [Solirubrobacteraceae bacterium]
MSALRRGLGALSRRLEKPELLAAFDAHARQAQREEVAMGAALAAALRGDATYVDVGTNRGQVLAQASRVAPEARLIAFEPIPALAAQLGTSFPGVDVRRLALGAEPGRAQFCHFRKLDGWSGLRRSPAITDEQGAPEMIEVDVSTLDGELGGVEPAVIKIDVEGAELAVLQGGRGTLARARPLVLFEHVAEAAALYGASSDEIFQELSKLGYELLPLTGGAPLSRETFAAGASGGSAVNWLARPER